MHLQAKRIAVCSMTAATGVVLLLLGAVLGLGIYACPLLVGLCLMPIGKQYGVRYQLLLWAAISVLSLLLVPDVEETFLFAGLFGWYPALYPKLQRLPRLLRLMVKLLLFNVVIVAVEALVMLVLAPEAVAGAMLAVLLILGNVTFLLYDAVIPRFERLADKYGKRLFDRL